MEELILRLKSLVRRHFANSIVTDLSANAVGKFTFLPQRRELTFEANVMSLSLRETDLLLLL
jgi:DNA-binding response OmpR family regulator